MKKEMIDSLVKAGILRIKQKDTEKIKSLIKSAEIDAQVVKNIPLDENSTNTIFKGIYDSIRELGEANWLLLGYEPTNHDISLEILKEINIKEKIKLNFLERFKKIRHDASYQGFRVTISQAGEIIDFWNKCGEDIIKILRQESETS